jgi:hypothetical protein
MKPDPDMKSTTGLGSGVVPSSGPQLVINIAPKVTRANSDNNLIFFI